MKIKTNIGQHCNNKSSNNEGGKKERGRICSMSLNK